MLKLEKKGRREICIGVRGKERVCNPAFLKALGLAFAIHLFGILLFQIGPFITINNTILPPSLVESDIHFDVGDSLVSASFEQEGIRKRDALEPPVSELKIPSMPAPLIQKQLDYTLISVSTNPFLEIEEDWEHLLRIEQPMPVYDPIQMHISGALADIVLLDRGISQKMYSSLNWKDFNSMKRELVSFIVQVEHMTGRIFWFEQTKFSDMPTVNMLALKIIEEMRFQGQLQHFVSAGEIEMLFSG
jgi:hypothetical protein